MVVESNRFLERRACPGHVSHPSVGGSEIVVRPGVLWIDSDRSPQPLRGPSPLLLGNQVVRFFKLFLGSRWNPELTDRHEGGGRRTLDLARAAHVPGFDFQVLSHTWAHKELGVPSGNLFTAQLHAVVSRGNIKELGNTFIVQKLFGQAKSRATDQRDLGGGLACTTIYK